MSVSPRLRKVKRKKAELEGVFMLLTPPLPSFGFHSFKNVKLFPPFSSFIQLAVHWISALPFFAMRNSCLNDWLTEDCVTGGVVVSPPRFRRKFSTDPKMAFFCFSFKIHLHYFYLVLLVNSMLPKQMYVFSMWSLCYLQVGYFFHSQDGIEWTMVPHIWFLKQFV